MGGQAQPAAAAQRTLDAAQVEAFYHDEFVADQTRQFLELTRGAEPGVLVDVGGGCGFFARRLQQLQPRWRVRVLDADARSVETARAAGVDAVRGDALRPDLRGDERMASFNLILHHLVAASDAGTLRLQQQALAAWLRPARALFVNEYIYESFVAELSGWLIYQVTSSRILSWIGARLARIAPAFKANTFGVGVRFRSHGDWERRVFVPAGWRVQQRLRGSDEPVSPAWRLLLIKSIHRDSFLLVPTDAGGTGPAQPTP